MLPWEEDARLAVILERVVAKCQLVFSSMSETERNLHVAGFLSENIQLILHNQHDRQNPS
jgi:hypothetical protein